MGWPVRLLAGGTGLVLFGGTFLLGGAQTSSASCAGVLNTAQVQADTVTIAGYTGVQLANAAAIMNAGSSLQVDQNGQIIAVMTAMGESGLQVLDHGDTAGPDSRGLFQQRSSWGSLATRMDPTGSATLFYQHLLAVPSWEQMTPSAAAHAVQNNADPNHYTKYYSAAAEVVQGLQLRYSVGCGNRQAGDDYPWPAGVAAAGSLSVLGYTYGNCTDFAAWRLNRDAGVTAAPWKYTWKNLTPNGGNAIDWKAAWIAHGWTVSTTPIVGSIAWWGSSAGAQGHVAYVAAVDGGKVTVEEYNWSPHKLAYDSRTINETVPGAYLYPPG